MGLLRKMVGLLGIVLSPNQICSVSTAILLLINQSFRTYQMVLLVRKRNRHRVSQQRCGSNTKNGWSSWKNAAPMVLLRIMVALLGIIVVLVRILSASPMVLLLISQSS